jgi:hypothetical protein
MTSRQIKAAQLRRRMAIQAMTPHRLPKRPSEVEQHMADTAVDMLVLIQMLPYIMGDLREALEASGQYRHEIKRRHRQVEEIIFTVAEPAYRIFARFNPETARGFLDRVDDLYFRIKSGYGLHGVEGAVSLLDAACRLIERYNHQLERTYYFEHAEPIYKIPSLLDCIPCKRRDITAQIAKALQPTSNPQAKRTAQQKKNITREYSFLRKINQQLPTSLKINKMKQHSEPTTDLQRPTPKPTF